MTTLVDTPRRRAASNSIWTYTAFFVAFFSTGSILELVLVYGYGEYEPKFGPALSAAFGVLLSLIVSMAGSASYALARSVRLTRAPEHVMLSFFAGALGGFVTLTLFDTWTVFVAAMALPALEGVLLALWPRFRWRVLVPAVAVILALVVTVNRADLVRSWAVKKVVRYVYWRNFEHFGQLGRPVEDLEFLNRQRLRRWLHGVRDLSRDPWGNPMQYVVLDDWDSPHPHRLNWDIKFAVWSNGPNGIDDGYARIDDVDVTNSGL